SRTMAAALTRRPVRPGKGMESDLQIFGNERRRWEELARSRPRQRKEQVSRCACPTRNRNEHELRSEIVRGSKRRIRNCAADFGTGTLCGSCFYPADRIANQIVRAL